MLYLFVKKIVPDAEEPVRKSHGAAGYDIFTLQEEIVKPGEVKKLHTGIAIAIVKEKYYTRIAGRSSTIFKWNLQVIEGVIDCDYRGEVLIVVKNLDPVNSVTIPKKTALAQLIIHKIDLPLVNTVPTLNETERGEGGFGSTTFPPGNQEQALEEGFLTDREREFIAWRYWNPSPAKE